MTLIKRLPVSFWLISILTLALVLRLFHLGYQSLWLDELYTMTMADPAHSIGEIYHLSKTLDGLSVLYFIIVNTFFKLFGYHAEALRSVSVVFGVLAVYGIYLLGRELFNRRTGLIAAAVLCVNQFHIYYSQDGRSYAMFATGTIFSFYFMLRFMRSTGWKTATGYGLAALFMLLSHFYGMFVLACQGLILAFVFFQRPKQEKMPFFWCSALALGIVVVGFLPIIPILQKWATLKSFWIPKPGNSAFADLYNEFFASFSVVHLSVLFIIFFLLRLFQHQPHDAMEPEEKKLLPSFYVLLCWILVVFFIPYLRSYLVVPMLYGRYMIGILPAIVLLVAAGIAHIADTNLRRVAAGLFVLISFLELSIAREYYTKPTKSDFRGVSAYVMQYNFINAEVRTMELKDHFNYYLRHDGNEAPVSGEWLDVILDAERAGKTRPVPFWVLTAHGLKIQMSDTNKAYLERNYTLDRSIDLLESGARFYVPKNRPADTLAFEHSFDLSKFSEFSSNGERFLPLYFNAETSSAPVLLAKGNYELIVQAQSTPAKAIAGKHAHLTVEFGGRQVASFYLEPKHYLYGDTIALDVPEEKNYQVKIRFDNDTMVGTLDRNVYIKQVKLIRR